MRLSSKNILKFIGTVVGVFFYCEYLIYYVVILQCSWPELEIKSFHENEQPVNVMILADTHLLGLRNGHWFDKLRREWQMHRAFQTAISLHHPDVVFVLGDLFDEGLWCSGLEFNAYVERFHSLFSLPKDVKMYVAVGNHDVGFHSKITPYLADRFSNQLNSPPVEMVTIRGNHFVLINSMAMEGDGCFLCNKAEVTLNNISSMLRCSRGVGSCHNTKQLEKYSRPILLQHFPLYRVSDEMCTESDAAPISERTVRFLERWDCLSRESTEYLMENFQPRVAFGGHTHHSCYIQHNINSPASDNERFTEYSVPSFSWRNRNDPSFMMGTFTPNQFKISKCRMPKESTVVRTYIVCTFLILLYIAYQVRKYCGKQMRYKHY